MAATAASPGAAASAEAGSPSRAFAPRSVWNARLAPDAPLDRRSEILVSTLRNRLTWGPPWINTTAFSTPVYTVGRRHRTVRVVLDTDHRPLKRAFRSVPIPRGARPADGSDRHMVVHQPGRDRMWEFWLAERRNGSWHARWGGKMSRLSSSPGYFQGQRRNWGATATSLPLMGGLIRAEDLRRRSIDHALAVAIPGSRAAYWSWPAKRADGSSTDPAAIPMGTRFRLNPRIDVRALRLPRAVRIMAEAVQRYGMIVRDEAPGVTFFAEDPKSIGRDPYHGPNGFFGGAYENRLLEQFPWAHLQALRTRLDCCWRRTPPQR